MRQLLAGYRQVSPSPNSTSRNLAVRILCLCKRRPQGRDLFTRPFGRFYYLPKLLADLGYEVHLALLGYQSELDEMRIEGHLNIHCTSLLPFGPVQYFLRTYQFARKLQPHWIIGFSDTWYGILAQHLATRLHTRSLIDAYDNYDAYIPWALPLHWAWHRACRRSTAITAAGPQLLSLMTRRQSQQISAVVPMAADPIFSPSDQTTSRQRLKLPIDIPLVGYFGSLHKSRDIDALFTLARNLRLRAPNIRIVISGRQSLKVPISLHNSVINLGYIPDDLVPFAFNAVDVVVSLTPPSTFGLYSYPAKIYEAMKCNIPVITICTDSTRWILASHPECLVPFGNPEALAERVLRAISWKRIDYHTMNSWHHSAEVLAGLLRIQ